MFAGITVRFPSKRPWTNMDKILAKAPMIKALLKPELVFRTVKPLVKMLIIKNRYAARPINPIPDAISR